MAPGPKEAGPSQRPWVERRTYAQRNLPYDPDATEANKTDRLQRSTFVRNLRKQQNGQAIPVEDERAALETWVKDMPLMENPGVVARRDTFCNIWLIFHEQLETGATEDTCWDYPIVAKWMLPFFRWRVSAWHSLSINTR